MENCPETPIFAERHISKFTFCSNEETPEITGFSDERIQITCGSRNSIRNSPIEYMKNPQDVITWLSTQDPIDEKQYLEKVIDEINDWVFFSEGSKFSEDFLMFIYTLQGMAQEFFKDQMLFSQYFLVSQSFLHKIQDDFIKRTGLSLPSSEKIEVIWENVLTHIEKTINDNKRIKSQQQKIQETIKALEKELKTLSKSLTITELPESPKRTNKDLARKPPVPNLTLPKPILLSSSIIDIDSLNIELLHLEAELKQNPSNPTATVNKILSIKSQISDLKTQKVIKTNRKLSEKVKKSLEKIETDWVINEKKSSTPQRNYICTEGSSKGTSPSNSFSTSRSISPLIFKNQTKTRSLKRIVRPEEPEDKEKIINDLKAKEEALEMLIETKERQENIMKKTIEDYKAKIKELEEERDEIMKIKARTFAQVRKVKDYETRLIKKEEKMNKEKPGIAKKSYNMVEDDEAIIELVKEKSKVKDNQRRLSKEIDCIQVEKVKISKMQALIDHKHEAIKIIWPKINSLLSSLTS
ncbi:hypothetical protein SteCoe_16787 [Stentor coeruleus]|uniref:Uncharacterized protein n=1 Tax=Stentor coeruleus TaxID=5963 RepID=A0A1R2C0I6_9CILI|nr:hypothetical protein SteCoe_16787 [Stentor coeruleus]